jgi:hypothetical protein
VTPDFDATVAALRASGFEVEARREHWGAARALTFTPDGHLVELMAHPPSKASGDSRERETV